MAAELDEQSILALHADEIGRLYDRPSRAIEKQRSITISAHEVKLLCVTGAYEAIMLASLKEQKRRALELLAAQTTAADEL